MTERLFGTDGIRGPFGVYPLDEGTVVELGRQLARELDGERPTPRPTRIVLGGDTRQSTETICSWLDRGLREEDVESIYCGVMPTPAIALLVRRFDAEAGVAVSASHNPHPDNGIKLFTREGFKWAPPAEEGLERRLLAGLASPPSRSGASTGSLTVDGRVAGLYVESLASTLPGSRPLSGLRLALDTANGAASPYARILFERLGAEVQVLHDRPDGSNINAGCGSTDPGELAALVRASTCDLGLAFDGDADRVIPVDETGRVQDGDAILYLWARALHREGDLEPVRIVATTMSNLGLVRSLAEIGIEVVRCEVGDRAVVETMRRCGIRLGGEQSGHIVHLGLSTTGDGLLTGLHLAALLARERIPVSALLRDLRRFPQVLHNVRVREKRSFDELPDVADCVARVKRRLGENGRLVLRYSGTEPLARIMIEGERSEEIEQMASEIAHRIEQHLGRA